MGEILLDERDFPSDATTTITGAHEVAQNIRESVAIPYGSLPWDREAGSHLFSMLNDIENPTETIAEIRRVATSLPGVVPSSVRVWRDARARRYRVSFVPIEQGTRTTVDVMETP